MLKACADTPATNEGPDDFVLATGESHRVREFVERLAFAHVGIDIALERKGGRGKG